MRKESFLDRIATWGVRLVPLIVGNQIVYSEVLNKWAENWQTSGKSRITTNDIETSKFVFVQSPYFGSRVSKSNLDGAQEPEHAPDFSPKILDIASNV